MKLGQHSKRFLLVAEGHVAVTFCVCDSDLFSRGKVDLGSAYNNVCGVFKLRRSIFFVRLFTFKSTNYLWIGVFVFFDGGSVCAHEPWQDMQPAKQ